MSALISVLRAFKAELRVRVPTESSVNSRRLRGLRGEATFAAQRVLLWPRAFRSIDGGWLQPTNGAADRRTDGFADGSQASPVQLSAYLTIVQTFS